MDKKGVTIILKLSQNNYELPLLSWEQGNYPVITIYGFQDFLNQFSLKNWNPPSYNDLMSMRGNSDTDFTVDYFQ